MTSRVRGIAWVVGLLQTLLAVRVVWRLVRTAGGRRIEVAAQSPLPDRVSVLVPVLNEAARLAPCLDGLVAQGPEVAEILVIDGGSTDATAAVVATFLARDPRVRWLDASPVPAGWNGKAHGLQWGLTQADPDSTWILTIDADVRPAAGLTRSLVAHASAEAVAALSVATRQELSGAAEALIHPALLTTLVYRFGIPGHATNRRMAVQANGQCFLVRRDRLVAAGGFAATRDSVCEDVTLARRVAAAGHAVGFYESDDLVSVAMYQGGIDAWRNWTRSLPMRDRYFGWRGWLGLLEIAVVQAAPVPLALLGWRGHRDQPLTRLNLLLLTVRIGVLAGTARAYPGRPWTYWLSPMCDVPAVIGVWLGAGRRRHVWRGRVIVRGGSR